jgi:hypothetical protein
MGVKLGLSLSLSLRMIRLKVYENRLLRRIFGPEKKDARGSWKRREEHV